MSAEELDAIDDDLLAAIAKVKGHAVQKADPRPVSKIYPVSQAAKEERAKAEGKAIAIWLEAEKKAIANPVPGQQMPDGTICLGKYSPADQNGVSLHRHFNVMVAGEDLHGGRWEYEDTVKYMAELKGWNGYDGAGYFNETELHEALRKGTYNGEWIIPTSAILMGYDAHNFKEAMTDNIRDRLRDIGSLRNAFSLSSDPMKDFFISCWSCTQSHTRPNEFFAVTIHSDTSITTGYYSECYRFSCRPVRLIPA